MKNLLKRAIKFLPMLICAGVLIGFLCLCPKGSEAKAQKESKVSLTLWQIDSFEGGKGSRADYLREVANEFSKRNNCYINVLSVSPEGAKLNLNEGNIPDILSYGAGMCGIEKQIKGYTTWCRGNYCLITLAENSDFADANSQNTVINEGKGNYSSVAAMFCGLQGAKSDAPTNAYVSLINGKYKYLLGTQRDIFRLKTRKVAFCVKPITQFNDLYQNISVTNNCGSDDCAEKFIDYLLSKSQNLTKIGMFYDKVKLYDGETAKCENIAIDYKITYPMNEETKSKMDAFIKEGNINMIKELLK